MIHMITKSVACDNRCLALQPHEYGLLQRSSKAAHCLMAPDVPQHHMCYPQYPATIRLGHDMFFCLGDCHDMWKLYGEALVWTLTLAVTCVVVVSK